MSKIVADPESKQQTPEAKDDNFRLRGKTGINEIKVI
jgi:hypothetical protein